MYHSVIFGEYSRFDKDKIEEVHEEVDNQDPGGQVVDLRKVLLR